MRQIITTAFTSVDGVMEAPSPGEPHRSAGWTFSSVEFDPAAYELKGREQEEAGALLLGRRSYELFAPVWPTMGEFARYNTLPRYVVSTGLEQDDERWPATILRSLDEVAELRAGEGAPLLVHASSVLAGALADADLVDRYHLLVFPVLLGAGKRMFSGSEHDMTKLRLVEHELYPNGIQKQIWDVIR